MVIMLVPILNIYRSNHNQSRHPIHNQNPMYNPYNVFLHNNLENSDLCGHTDNKHPASYLVVSYNCFLNSFLYKIFHELRSQMLL